MLDPQNHEELHLQLNVLTKKLADSKEPIVREALQARIDLIVKQLGPNLVDAPARPAEVLPTKPTAQQQMDADNLVRQAKVAKMRGQVQESTTLLQQAAAVAPGSAVVLETLGDELFERKKYGEARVAYEKAHKMEPQNAGIERKFAEMVLRTSSGMSFETAMSMGNAPFVQTGEEVASAKAATLLTILFPGLGQLVLGETKKGLILIALNVVCIVLFILLGGTAKVTAGQHMSVSGFLLIPLLGDLAIYWIAIQGCASRVKKHWTPPARSTDRPVPPVNLPFE